MMIHHSREEDKIMIELDSLKDKDKGRWVLYDNRIDDYEIGRVKAWDDTNIFIIYKCAGDWNHYANYTAQATHPGDLTFLQFSIEGVE